MSDWNLFVREARTGSFHGTRNLAMRFLHAYTHTHKCSPTQRQKSRERIRGAEKEINSGGRNLVGELIKKFMGLLVAALLKRG